MAVSCRPARTPTAPAPGLLLEQFTLEFQRLTLWPGGLFRRAKVCLRWAHLAPNSRGTRSSTQVIANLFCHGAGLLRHGLAVNVRIVASDAGRAGRLVDMLVPVALVGCVQGRRHVAAPARAVARLAARILQVRRGRFRW